MESPDTSYARALGSLEGKMDMIVTSMNALAASFESLEKGRLSRLEIAFATLKAESADKARDSALWTSSIISLCIAIISAFTVYYFHL